jgi:RNA polymerase sigma factor (sigma-70 family)
VTQTRRVTHDDLAFARRLSDGEPDAVLAFERQYRGLVLHALGRALRKWRPDSPVEPDDYAQDFMGFLFSDAGKRLRSFAGRSSFSSWLYTVALRYFQRAFSLLAKDRRTDDVLAQLPDRADNNPERLASLAHASTQVRAAVHRLPAADQLYVRLFFVEGLNASEVARTLGKGTSAVRMKKMRILESLRQMLGDELGGAS